MGKTRANSPRAERSDNFTGAITSRALELEDLLHRDRLTFHAGNLRDRNDSARTICETGHLNDKIDCRSDLLAHRPVRESHPRHLDHRLKTGEGVSGCVGVDRGERSVVTGVHSLKHIDSLATADLANNNAVGAHAQRVADQIALRDLTAAFDVVRTSLQTHHVRLLHLELCRVFDRYYALISRNKGGQSVQQSSFTCARASRDDDVQ